jgi:cell wall-associated NlpC family hydrolase
MKKISTTIMLFILIHFLSGCSQGYRSNAYGIQQAQQKQNNQVYQQAQRNKQIKQASAKTRPIKKTRYTSQRSHSSAVVNQHPARNLMTRIAHSTIGATYKWGGNTPKQGFDCSGLMKYVHENALGIKIPRTAAQQRDKSRTISYAQLQPGDMLFFKTGRNSNHVGVYVGNRKFVHAASGSKHVKMASMDSSYWHKRFVKFGTFL